MKNIIKLIGVWLLRFGFYVAIILAIGTIIGSIGFVTIGSLLAREYGFEFLLKKGASIGFRYAGVWAGGASIILCFIKAKQISNQKECT